MQRKRTESLKIKRKTHLFGIKYKNVMKEYEKGSKLKGSIRNGYRNVESTGRRRTAVCFVSLVVVSAIR